MDAERFFREYQDHLAPRLDTYEQAIYLYILRHSRLLGLEEVVIGFKSARRRMACGVGTHGSPMSEGTVAEKLASLQSKGCITIVDSGRDGRRFRLLLPSEIPGVVVAAQAAAPRDLETEDFFAVPENRQRILSREQSRCFYCLRALNATNNVIEHVVSRPDGSNNYRNVVAACRQCNNRKGSVAAEGWLRTLYREGMLDASELQDRLGTLERLQSGDLKPPPAG